MDARTARLKLKVAWIGKTRNPAIQSLSDEFLRRIGHYAEIEGLTFKNETSLLELSNGRRRPQCVLILLDGKGKQMSSDELARFLGEHQTRSSAPLLFAIGPASGFADETRQAATLLLSLGKMTLAHELARIVLLEQLYRAFTILNRHPYHLAH
jgi:23S rRNA (pseudouridine1915-N3)-methyltransferase